jgi:hypothetical protein
MQLRRSGYFCGACSRSRRTTASTNAAADAGCLYGLNTQHDPFRASSLAWSTRCDDNGLLAALEPIDFLFEFGDPLLAVRSISTGSMSMLIGTVIRSFCCLAYCEVKIAFGIMPWMPLVPSTTWVT